MGFILNVSTAWKGGGIMQEQRRRYGCTKVLVLGSLYDALEQMKWLLVSANSDDGIVVIQEPTMGISYVIRVCPDGKQTVELYAALASGEFAGKSLPEEIMNCLMQTLDEILTAVNVRRLLPHEEAEHSKLQKEGTEHESKESI
jgi:hypothetical protein